MTGRRRLLALLLVVVPVVWGAGLLGQNRTGGGPSITTGAWPHYTGDMRGWKYSPLAQIDASNFGKLEVAWRFKTDIFGPRPEFKLEGTPLAVSGRPRPDAPTLSLVRDRLSKELTRIDGRV